MNWVGPRYLETLGTPRIAGRDFQFEDVAVDTDHRPANDPRTMAATELGILRQFTSIIV